MTTANGAGYAVVGQVHAAIRPLVNNGDVKPPPRRLARFISLSRLNLPAMQQERLWSQPMGGGQIAPQSRSCAKKLLDVGGR
jgi:hypothetical protein